MTTLGFLTPATDTRSTVAEVDRRVNPPERLEFRAPMHQRDGLVAVRNPELADERSDMRANARGLQRQPVGDLSSRHALGERREDLPLAARQARAEVFDRRASELRLGAVEALDHPCDELGRDRRPT